jgi:phosphoenolpyruvate phosphomutase
MSEAARRLRDLINGPDVVRIMGAHNALGAKLVERAGFDGVWASGLEISTSHGVPDANILTQSEVLAAAQSMADRVSIPVVVDCDTGFGNSNNVIHMVRKFEAAGVGGVCIEDKKFPKVNSFVPGRQELAPLAEFVGKIMAGKTAQRSPDFMIIARIEALIAGRGMMEALRRADAYERAGADAILIHSKASTAEPVAEFMQAWKGSIPVVVVPTTYPELDADALGKLGASMVIYANHGMRASIRAMEDVYEEVLRTGSTMSIENRIVSMKQVFDLQGMPEMKANEREFLRTEDEKVSAVILAAGPHGTSPSMAEIAKDVPISMLDIRGRPLLQRQVEVLNRAGIQDITVVKGYRGHQVGIEGVRLVENEAWADSGDFESFVRGVAEAPGRVLVIYGDVLFDPSALNRLMTSEGDVLLLLDRTFSRRQQVDRRSLDLVVISEPSGGQRRHLDSDTPKQTYRIGRNLDPEEADCEFTGLSLMTREGIEMLMGVVEDARRGGGEGAFHDAPRLGLASLTDVFQEAIDRGEEIAGVEVSSGWLEIQTFTDYELACQIVGT